MRNSIEGREKSNNKLIVVCLVLLQFFTSIIIDIDINAQQLGLPDVKALAERAINKSQQVKIRELQVDKAKLDKIKVYESYLPKVSFEASFTHMNAPLEFPDNFKNLLEGTERLLIKEGVAMNMAANNLPATAIPGLSTPYSYTPLAQTLSTQFQEISPIQNQNFAKASINAQMMLFSGFKAPLTAKAANHQIAALKLLSENEKINLILQVISVYDKLAILNQSKDVLTSTEKYLDEQKRYVEKAVNNGLAIDLNRQKLELAKKQLEVRRIELDNNCKLLYSKIEELTEFPSDSVALLKPTLSIWILSEFNGNSADRFDIKALDEAIVATNMKKRAEWADYMPKVMAFGKRELRENDLTMLDPKWYVGIGVRWTIFDGLTAQNNASQIKLDKLILEGKKLEAIELSDLNLKRLTFEIEKNIKLIETNEKQEQLARQILELSSKQYAQGLISLNEHLSAVNDYEKSRLDFLQAIAQERASVADYLAASGKLVLSEVR
jgi:outer membrane protein TolC